LNADVSGNAPHPAEVKRNVTGSAEATSLYEPPPDREDGGIDGNCNQERLQGLNGRELGMSEIVMPFSRKMCGSVNLDPFLPDHLVSKPASCSVAIAQRT
jgi:hypothetical protein